MLSRRAVSKLSLLCCVFKSPIFRQDFSGAECMGGRAPRRPGPRRGIRSAAWGFCDTAPMPTFDALIAEAESAPVEGWDFSFLDGRATEQRPSWGYAKLLAARMAESRAAPRRADRRRRGARRDPRRTAEARRHRVLVREPERRTRRACSPRRGGCRGRQRLPPVPLREFRSRGEQAPGHDPVGRDRTGTRARRRLPLPAGRRGLQPGAHRLHDGASAALRGAQRRPPPRARTAGLELTVAGDEWLRVVFLDVGAVADFLRKVPWTVPDFSVWRYRHRLWAMHEQIEREGEFRRTPTASSSRRAGP